MQNNGTNNNDISAATDTMHSLDEWTTVVDSEVFIDEKDTFEHDVEGCDGFAYGEEDSNTVSASE